LQFAQKFHLFSPSSLNSIILYLFFFYYRNLASHIHFCGPTNFVIWILGV
jgi:hypothetical protein